MNSAFLEISLILTIALAVAGVMHLLRQPLIIGHIITGLIAGPYVLNLLRNSDTLNVFSTIGITLLLFVVGLGLNPKVIKEVGKVSLITGIGQVIFTSSIGYALIKMLGFGTVESICIAIALTFSSTIIIVKLLTDKHEVNQLYGKISIGFLLVQDVVAALALVALVALSEKQSLIVAIPSLLVKLTLAVVAVWLLAKFVLRFAIQTVARSSEMLFLFALAWGLGIATGFKVTGLSLEVGALVAGVALASTTYSLEIASKLKPLRDFFIVIFFILLGAGLSLGDVAPVALPAILLSLFVLIGNPLIVMILMRFLGYSKKTNFKAGLAVAQISEFSLIFMVLAKNTGLVNDAANTLVALVGIITIAASTYMIIYADQLFKLLEPLLGIFEKKSVRKESLKKSGYDVILFGSTRAGREFISIFSKMKTSLLVIDHNPDQVAELVAAGINAQFGDAGDVELLQELNLPQAKMVVSIVSDDAVNRLILEQFPERSKTVRILMSDDISLAEKLYQAGATYIMMPHYIGGTHTVKLIEKHGFDLSLFIKEQEAHRKYLIHEIKS
jgi:Kef-type K+ transport system membrane component KefB